MKVKIGKFNEMLNQKLWQCEEEGLFCDVTLRADNKSFGAHGAVLESASEYFAHELSTSKDGKHVLKIG